MEDQTAAAKHLSDAADCLDQARVKIDGFGQTGIVWQLRKHPVLWISLFQITNLCAARCKQEHWRFVAGVLGNLCCLFARDFLRAHDLVDRLTQARVVQRCAARTQHVCEFHRIALWLDKRILPRNRRPLIILLFSSDSDIITHSFSKDNFFLKMGYRERAKVFLYGFVLFLLVSLLVFAVSVSVGKVDEACFVVDMLRAHVPGVPPAPYVAHTHEPVSYGTVCFNTKQQMIKWRIDETFQIAYGMDSVSDLRLNGPLTNSTLVLKDAPSKPVEFAPVLLALGVSRRLSVRELTGSTVIEVSKMYDVLRNPEDYYMSIYVLAKRTNQHVEVGRGRLRVPKKKIRSADAGKSK
jgi:hypothetical protein